MRELLANLSAVGARPRGEDVLHGEALAAVAALARHDGNVEDAVLQLTGEGAPAWTEVVRDAWQAAARRVAVWEAPNREPAPLSQEELSSRPFATRWAEQRLLYYTLMDRVGEAGVLEWWEYGRRRHEHVLFRRTLRLGLREVPVPPAGAGVWRE